MSTKNNNPLFDENESTDRDRTLRDNLGETTDADNLVFNKEKNSFELDVKSDDPDYDHPDPYDTAARNGGDENSDYDEANPYVGDEYEKETGLEHDLDKLGMHVDGSGSSVRLSKKMKSSLKQMKIQEMIWMKKDILKTTVIQTRRNDEHRTN